jgi:transcriptional regulator with XRE-family HTH domain
MEAGLAGIQGFDFTVLKQLRAQRGVSLQKLAEQTNLSYATLSRIESNRYKPSLNTLATLAKYFEMSPAHLLELTATSRVETSRESVVNVEEMIRRAVDFQDIRLRIGIGKAGAVEDPPHQHLGFYQVTWVLSGRMVVTVHQDEYELGKGEVIRFDAGFAHAVSYLEDTQFVVALVPKRTQ